MCYSAMVWQDYHSYVRRFGARISILEFVRLFEVRDAGGRVKIPKGLETPFVAAHEFGGEDERYLAELIRRHHQREGAKLGAELFKQIDRLANAEQSLAKRATKKSEEDKRISTDKIGALKRKLEDLKRSTPESRDSRIYPGEYALVMIEQGGERLVLPMRYQCRVAGKPASYDQQFPATYNARIDNLEGFWRPLFGRNHGVVVINRFFENVERTGENGQARNQVLEFRPQGGEEMIVACLWSRWTGSDGEELLSFAAITDDPPAEVLAAGHDRCIIALKPENMVAWLRPEARPLDELYAILRDAQPHVFVHKESQ
jgi:putative SOS response-associated peptidase YedK